jgi:proteasome beta subunit
MQGLAVLPIFAGYDELRSSGRLWDFDITGGRYEERDFVATGSGAGPASTVLKVGFRSSLGADEAVDLACSALWEAADVDSATGGPDALRGIYPIVATISEMGWQQIDDSDLVRRFDALSSRRREAQGG